VTAGHPVRNADASPEANAAVRRRLALLTHRRETDV